MLKFIVVVVVVVAVLAWLLRRATPAVKPPPPPTPKQPPRLEEMVVCAHCGVHLPERDAVQRASRHYCGLPHADAGPRNLEP